METLSSSRTWIGVVVAVAGNVTISLALNCQKLAHTRLQKHQHQQSDGSHFREESGSNDSASDSPIPSQSGTTRERNGHASSEDTSSKGHNGNGMDTMFLHSKLWWLGLALMTIGEGGNFISYGFAPASLVAPLGAVALLSNVIISPILLGEKFRLSDIGGILLAIIGAVTVVFSSKQNDVRLDPGELLQAIKRLEFVIYTAVSVSAGALLAIISRTSLGDRWVLIDVGTCAIFGGFTVLSTKGISSLISGGKPIEALKFPITYGLVLVLAITAVVQITYLNRALQRFDSREVIPTQFVFFTISAIVGSAILYRDFENMDAHRLVNFLFGCLTTFGGVFVLTWRSNGSGHNDRGHTDQSSVDDEEDWTEGGDEEGDTQVVREEGLENEPLLSDSGRNKGRQRIDFAEPAIEEMQRQRPSDALRVPSSTKSYTSGKRPRSRTNSPRAASTRLSGSLDRSSGFSRSASNQSGGGALSSSPFAGLRTPKLGVIGLDRPTGLSAGHYLLLANPPTSFTLNPVTPVPGSSARGGFTRGLSSQYGAIGNRNGPAAFLPLPVTTPSGTGSSRNVSQQDKRALSQHNNNEADQVERHAEDVTPVSAATAAESIVSPEAETSANRGGDELSSRLREHSRSASGTSTPHQP